MWEISSTRAHLEKALAISDPERDRDLAFRFGHDPRISASVQLGVVLWLLGEVVRAAQLFQDVGASIPDVSHLGTTAQGNFHAAAFEVMRGNHVRAAEFIRALASVAHEHDLALWKTLAYFLEGWSAWRAGDRNAGLVQMRAGVAQLAEREISLFSGLIRTELAQAEAESGEVDASLVTLENALAYCERIGQRWFDAEIHRVRGEILLKKHADSPVPAEDAYLAAIAIAHRQKARSFELRAALSLARLYQSTGRTVDAHAVLAPALEGFSPTPEMPEIAEAQALLATLAEMDDVKAGAAQRHRLTQLHVSYANALFAARGFGAPETTGAFRRARDSASGDKDASDRLAADYGLWAGSYVRGELSPMRAHVEAFLSDVQARPDSPEAGVAYRVCGVTHQFAGEYAEARENLERALALFQPGRDDDLAFRFGLDVGVTVLICSAMALWPLGEVERALSLVESAQARLAAVAHAGTLAFARQHFAVFELMRRDRQRGAHNAFELARLARDHDLTMFRAFAAFFEGWAIAEDSTPGGGLEDMRRGVALLLEQNILLFDGLLKIALAEAEARAGDCDRANAILDEALATSERTGYRAFEAELHRARGEMLLRRNSARPAPAEEAFLTAIAIAKQQGTRSFGLRAALSLARLYQSTGRPVEAHAVLAPALDGISPTSEMPEIAEAQALLAALADSEEVKTAVAQRERRLRLQTAYGQAMMYSKGFAAEETKAAFARATELAADSGDFSERFAAFHGLWTFALVRGELKSARELASTFLREAEAAGRLVEAGVARRGLAIISFNLGEFAEARTHCERALAACDPERDREARERFSEDTGLTAMSWLGVTMWQLGEVDRARELIETANRRAAELGHAPSMAHPLQAEFFLEFWRGDAAAALAAAEALEALSRQHGMANWCAVAQLRVVWAQCRLHDPAAGAIDPKGAFEALAEQGMRGGWLSKALLAECELRTQGVDGALARIDEALALARQGEARSDLPLAHLLRGEILLTLDSANPATAEEAFRTALAIARQQGARSWGLRAALSLARLHQSTGRPADALAILTPALEGFSPTRELPEIAEAQALLTGLAQATA